MIERTELPHRLGWIPQVRDPRDYTVFQGELSYLLRTNLPGEVPTKNIDMMKKFLKVENQGDFGSCTAHAGTGIAEYYGKNVLGKPKQLSRFFLYWFSRYLMNGEYTPTGDDGCDIRSVMKAMQKFGMPPETNWRYTKNNLNRKPTQKVMDLADDYTVAKYFLLDSFPFNASNLFAQAKVFINRGIPIMFGSTVYESIFDVGSDGLEPFPTSNDQPAGGHARIICGFDDNIEIPDTDDKKMYQGAFLVRNSWSSNWGWKGYSYVPYEIWRNYLASDHMGIINENWLAKMEIYND